MGAYYNENDPFAAAWLRELIKAGLIADGEVDERSIEQVEPSDVRGFTQCHFFAGIGVWSYALRGAGWTDAARVWTGSCPCQSFSSSGKREGFSDKRHLWPAWFRLIRECKPDVCFGEQVASNDGLSWFDVVSSDLEGAGYTIGAADLCAAGFGAPHIRQRLYFVAQSERGRRDTNFRNDDGRRVDNFRASEAGIVAESGSEQNKPTTEGRLHADACRDRAVGIMANTQDTNGRRTGNQGDGRRRTPQVGRSSTAGELAQPNVTESGNGELQRSGRLLQLEENPLVGFWASAEWIHCRPESKYPDGRWRPVEPGTFPLAHGATNRVGRLRGYGNALNAEVAKGFIEAYLEID